MLKSPLNKQVSASNATKDATPYSVLNKLSNEHVKLNRQFAGCLENKSVAILGRGPSLRACSRTLIESYDVVVRVHRPAPIEGWWPPPLVQEGWQSIVGARTDILYSSFGFTKDIDDEMEFFDRMTSSFLDEGGKFMCRPHPRYALDDWLTSHKLAERLPLRFVDIGLYLELWRKIGATPFPGTIVVSDILAYPVKEVFIGGMTCYLDNSPVGIIESNGFRVSKRDFNYIRSIWRANEDRITVDPIMKDLFLSIDEAVPTRAPEAHEVYQADEDGVVNNYLR